MKRVIRPIVYEVEETDKFLYTLREEINNNYRDRKDDSYILLNYPTVYVHSWKRSKGNPKKRYSVYIGESNDVVERTKEHYKAAENDKNWQYHFINDGDIPIMYIIGHEHFNKSLTLDVENRLMHYISSMGNVDTIHNGRGNPQNGYYPSDEFDEIFHSIWKSLRKKNPDLFLSESEIRDSAIFKASPLHKLTDEQIAAKNLIIEKVTDALNENKDGQLIFVCGEAGTGKTVLNSATFYELISNETDLKCCLMVNHDEQLCVYEEIAKKLKIVDNSNKDKERVVTKPTIFINSHNSDNKIDVAFVDEAHLLLTQGKQSYQGKNQLQDIIDRAKVTVVMFDKCQILTAEQIWETELLDHYIELADSQGNYITLKNQLRMHCSDTTKSWIDGITKEKVIKPFVHDNNYEIRCFDSPKELHEAIKSKAENKDSKLSRLIASYDWEYSTARRPDDKKYWGVEIGDWSLPWNRELEREEPNRFNNLAWAEQPQTINECGSTYTIQGFDLSYAGVIIGPSVGYENGKIVFNPENSYNDRATRNRTLSDGTKKNFGEELIQHELRVLMTRGVKGLYIYACDNNLRKKLKEVLSEK